MRLIISNSTKNNIELPYLYLRKEDTKLFSYRASLIKTLKIYIKKYCSFNPNKYNILYLSIIYLDIILSKKKISLSCDKNLKYLCLCCFLLSLKFMDDYDLSKKIIKNFCQNYKEEYKIFEIQCLLLLDYNLMHTTAYDYLNLILINDSKKLLSTCLSYLYLLCEENLYINYSPFYIAIAIINLAKNKLNDNSHNHYDKYFHDQRVKFLYQKFNLTINPPTIRYPISGIEDQKDNELNIYDENENRKNYQIRNYHSKQSSNVNINTNSNFEYNLDTSKNKTPSRIFVKRNLNNNVFYIKKEKPKSNSHNFEESKNNNQNNKLKVWSRRKEEILKKINIKLEEIKNNNKNIYRIPKINSQKFPIPTNTSSLQNLNNNYYNITNENLFIRHKYKLKPNEFSNKDLSIHLYGKKLNATKSSNNVKRRYIYTNNNSSLNFKLVSGLSKEKLDKLSRNFSKNWINPFDKSSIIKKK
jgi:hypothetical protein